VSSSDDGLIEQANPDDYIAFFVEINCKKENYKNKQDNRRSHFSRAVLSYHPFPADPICSESGSDGMIPSAA